MAQSSQDGTNTPPSQDPSTYTSPWVQAVTNNLKPIGLALGGIVLIAAVISGYSYYKTRSMRNAQQTVDRILTEKQGAAEIKALEGFLPQAPSSMRTGLNLQLARLCLQEGEYAKAYTHWTTIKENSEDKDLQIVAALGQAAALDGQQKPTQALHLLQDLASEAPQRYQRSLKLKIALLAEEAHNWQQALNAYQAIQSMSDLASQRDEYIDHKISMLKAKIDSANS